MNPLSPSNLCLCLVLAWPAGIFGSPFVSARAGQLPPADPAPRVREKAALVYCHGDLFESVMTCGEAEDGSASSASDRLPGTLEKRGDGASTAGSLPPLPSPWRQIGLAGNAADPESELPSWALHAWPPAAPGTVTEHAPAWFPGSAPVRQRLPLELALLGETVSGPPPSDFDYAEWVTRTDLRNLDRYASGRRPEKHDEHWDPGKVRSRDIEYTLEVYLLGSLSPYLDTSESWGADLLGSLIDYIDGMSRLARVVQDTFFKNNLFRPSNPFNRFGAESGLREPGHRDGSSRALEVGPVWKWKGDISLDVGGGLNLEEVILNVGRLRFSRDFEIRFDLFYDADG